MLASNLDVVESVEDKVNEATGAVSEAQDKVSTCLGRHPPQSTMHELRMRATTAISSSTLKSPYRP